MRFLTAHWQKLAMINYKVDPHLLQAYVPAQTELDYWNGACYVSLVGFMFANTRLLGVKIPGHTDFEEVNLRFYVRRHDGCQWKRGVVFIREIVPRPAITWVANTVYGERYATMPMTHRWVENPGTLEVHYDWKLGKNWQKIMVLAENRLIPIEPGSEAEFITEHYWGYARRGEHKTIEYEVTHPRWEQYPVVRSSVQADFGALYGPEFAVLQTQEPASVLLAAGSAITVEQRRVL